MPSNADAAPLGSHTQGGRGAPIFIVGTQRSGSTLLRLLLNAHPEVAIPEEARFLGPLLRRGYLGRELRGRRLEKIVAYLRANEQLRLWNLDSGVFFDAVAAKESWRLAELIELLFECYRRSEGKARWGDKSLFFWRIGMLGQLFPTARFVHIVRDGRAAFVSWRKLDPSKASAPVMALDWAYKVWRIERALRRLDSGRAYVLRYEDLVRRPAESLESLCGFLDLEYDPRMLDFHRTSRRYVGEHHSTLIFKPIDGDNTSRWREHLSGEELARFDLLAARTLRRYDYRVDSRASTARALRTLFALVLAIPRRVAEVVKARLTYRRAVRRGSKVGAVPVGSLPPGPRRE